jgi:ABC-2 type transport system permease protein
MNTQSDAVSESFDSQRGAPAVMSATRPMYWSVRRELWENRSIYVAPLAAAGVYLLGFLISLIRLPQKMRVLSALDPAHQRAAVTMPYEFAAGLIMVTTLIVAVFYCLEALHGERRDRSILFWKSLPVSDMTTVLSKAIIPIVILQLVAFAVTFATQWIMLLLSSVVLLGSGSGVNVATLWTQVSLFRMSVMLFGHLLIMHGLWYAPVYAWLLLVSAWARRAAFLWAVLPWLVIFAVEKVAFNTSHFAAMLGHHFAGGGQGAVEPGISPIIGMQLSSLSSPGFWIGLAFAAIFLAAAVRVRRYQGPI